MVKTTKGYNKYVGKYGPITLDVDFADLPVSLWGWLEEGNPAQWPLLTDERVGEYLEQCVDGGIPISAESFTRHFWMDGSGHFRFPIAGGTDVVAQGFEGFVRMVANKETVGF